MRPLRGVYTALVTPFEAGGEVDWDGYDRLLDLQAEGRVDGVVVGGTTAESPTLRPAEVLRMVGRARDRLPSRAEVIAGTGRNDAAAAHELTRSVLDLGIRTVLLVDPSYNAPSSPEIRREYLQPLASRFPDAQFVAYVVPSRTGTRLDPVDLFLARAACPNIVALKDATGEGTYARRTRHLLPAPFSLLAGDDGRAVEMLRDPQTRADGVVSVVANLAPGLVRSIVDAALAGDDASLRRFDAPFAALSRMVSFEIEETSPLGRVSVRVRNPVPVKTAFGVLGAGWARCRAPLGRLGPSAFDRVYRTIVQLDGQDPETFRMARHLLGLPSGAPGPFEELQRRLGYVEY